MRIAVLLKDRCKPKNCSYECIKFCPRVRAGDETIVKGEDGKPEISEELCVGCGICVHKCPFEAIKIIGLKEELETDLIHQFGKNGFRLFRLPIPKKGTCMGILGPNGIGKTTAIKILSGQIIPNLGDYEQEPTWDQVISYYAGTELQEHFKHIATEHITSVVKPQYVDRIPRVMKGTIQEILKKTDTSGNMDDLVAHLNLEHVLDKRIDEKTISGGELQLVSLAAALLKDVDIYFFDEPSSYLDIHQRLKVSRIIRTLAQTK
jgi:ATP-binding cassette subfamily E protein 1